MRPSALERSRYETVLCGKAFRPSADEEVFEENGMRITTLQERQLVFS
jgi:hypothetical protein